MEPADTHPRDRSPELNADTVGPNASLFQTTAEVLADGTTVFSLDGELDLATTPRFESRLSAAVDGGRGAVIVDLTNCRFLESSALAVLKRSNTQLDNARPLSLVVSNPNILKLFAIASLDGVFRIHSTRAEATTSELA